MPPWKPLYLRAADEAAMMHALDSAGLVGTDVDTGDQMVGGDPHIIRLKLLPDLSEPTGNMLSTPEGFEYPEMRAVPGYHVNVFLHPDFQHVFKSALSEVLIEPEPVTPLVGWRS